MKVYHIKDEYISYLSQKDNTVLQNKNEKRPYVGVVLEVKNHSYYVPLSSPKPKHKRMKNAKDFHKIANGTYGAINFNKMIPVKDDCIINFDFKAEKDKQYRLLLQNQYKYLRSMEDIIRKKSENIYHIFHTNDEDLTKADLAIKRRCCNFDLLEKMCKNFNSNK